MINISEINIPVNIAVNRAIDDLFQTSKDVIFAIGNYIRIKKRSIKALVDGVLQIQEKYGYVEDSGRLKEIDIITSLYLSAYPDTNPSNDIEFRRFYSHYRKTKSYYYGSNGTRTVNGKSGEVNIVKREDVMKFLIYLEDSDFQSIIREIETARQAN